MYLSASQLHRDKIHNYEKTCEKFAPNVEKNVRQKCIKYVRLERSKYVRIFYVSILHLRSHCFEENNLDKTCNNWSSEFVESRAM